MSSISSSDGGYQYSQRKLSDLEKEMRDETRRARERYDERADSLEKNYADANVRRNQESDEAVQKIRDDSAEHSARDRQNFRSETEQMKAQTYDKYGRAQNEISFHKKRADEAIQQAQQTLAEMDKKNIDSSDARMDKVNEASRDRLKINAEIDRKSRQGETDKLRSSISNLLDSEKTYMKEKGQGTADARREVENEARTQQKVITRQYDNVIDQLHTKLNESDHHMSKLMDEEKRDREAYYTGLIGKVTRENDDDRRVIRDADLLALQQQKDLNHREADQNQQLLERRSQNLIEDSKQALTHQAETFHQEAQIQKQSDAGKMARLEDQLHQQMTSSDGTWISAAAEEGMRKNFTAEYEKKHEAEVLRDKGKTDSLQREYQDRLESTLRDENSKVANTELQRRADEHMLRQGYMNHFDDMQKSQELALRDKEYQSNRQLETSQHNYANTLERQRHDYDSLLAQSRTDSSVKITDVRQQAEFDSKMAQRNFAIQQNELIRNYDRKLDEQKTYYEDTIQNLKDQLTQNNREAERRTHQLLDDQQKGYEQKIAQNEFQSKERERTIGNNYQDQIEKLKRSNALLIQRKTEKS